MRPIEEVLIDIQDHLVPVLDPWEQMLYHYLFRHTYLNETRCITVPARSIGPKLGRGRKGASELARNNIPKKLRTLEEKGAIKILSKSKNGTEVELFLPHEIPGVIPKPTAEDEEDIEAIDFFSTSKNRQRIFTRDKNTCRYCLSVIDSTKASIDHIAPQTDRANHSFKNLVTACFECNSSKSSQCAEDFLREKYRRHFLSAEEFESCLDYIKRVESGDVIPQ